METMLGVMLDCSRNAVLKVETVKQYACLLKKMGYNTLMLYTEDTYEVENQPYFGHLRGRYSKVELKEMATSEKTEIALADLVSIMKEKCVK